jgi:hypothetical protein
VKNTSWARPCLSHLSSSLHLGTRWHPGLPLWVLLQWGSYPQAFVLFWDLIGPPWPCPYWVWMSVGCHLIRLDHHRTAPQGLGHIQDLYPLGSFPGFWTQLCSQPGSSPPPTGLHNPGLSPACLLPGAETPALAAPVVLSTKLDPVVSIDNSLDFSIVVYSANRTLHFWSWICFCPQVKCTHTVGSIRGLIPIDGRSISWNIMFCLENVGKKTLNTKCNTPLLVPFRFDPMVLAQLGLAPWDLICFNLTFCLSLCGNFQPRLCSCCLLSYDPHVLPYSNSIMTNKIFIKFGMEFIPLGDVLDSYHLISYNW